MSDPETTSRLRQLQGPSIQIDPLFSYYLNRTPESIADEIRNAGYQIVHYFIVNEHEVSIDLIDAFHKHGITVWALVIGNGTFDTRHLPVHWREWRMGMLKDPKDGFERLSLFAPDYVRWKKGVLVRLVQEFPFDGIEIAEPYFPEWDGIRRGIYGDVGPFAQAAFQKQFGMEMPEFTDKKADNYYTKVPEIYKQWILFRVETVNRFIHELMNGVDGVRTARPDILVATWSLAVHASNALEKVKEWQGIDAISMIGLVKPDIHFLQTHWPDWMQRFLSPHYVKGYEVIAAPIRDTYPTLPLGIQTDIGSVARMVRSREWLNQFQNTVYDLGYDTWTAYEYHLGGYMSSEAPIPIYATRTGEEELLISFSKRIDPKSRVTIVLYPLSQEGLVEDKVVTDMRLEFDGNRVRAREIHLPRDPFEVEVRGMKDTPSLWYSKGKRANQVPHGIRIRVQ
ncbi:N-acyl-D-glucosamine 2-epimerase [Paenibacillus glacialis]|uniref:N-acyl-D-glucosamine 2-epimerase n=1 Tax=Paenibacillus glacialis TaxID=494026 RepID=A0A168NND4_9BACL|nr:N-acyl-D-glucosamine 2-epimerase [Paenibacillus glacialis]OAB45964.1 N-acyl-D-glucosamine 2-epimerase [Paenibacillus glacialis]